MSVKGVVMGRDLLLEARPTWFGVFRDQPDDVRGVVGCRVPTQAHGCGRCGH
jgi:hypothetical protein